MRGPEGLGRDGAGMNDWLVERYEDLWLVGGETHARDVPVKVIGRGQFGVGRI